MGLRRLICLFLTVISYTLADHACPSTFRMQPSDKVFRHLAGIEVRPGNRRFTLAGIFPITAQDCKTILKAKSFSGFQRAEAMVYALNKVNLDVKNGKKKVALDGYIIDSCINGISAAAALRTAIKDTENIAGTLKSLCFFFIFEK